MIYCKMCSSTSISLRGEIEGYRKSIFFKIYECNDCLVSWSDPVEVDATLYEKIYLNSHMVLGYSRYSILADELKSSARPYDYLMNFEANYYSVLNAVDEYSRANANIKIAEIGCGKGYLTFSLRQAGFDCVGFDLSSNAINFAKSHFGDFYHCRDITKNLADDQQFDVIICMELIEHLADPSETIKKLLKKLNSNGILIISTPQKSYSNNSIWDTDLPPVHLWWFSKKSIIGFAKSLGVSLRFIDAYHFYIATGSKYPRSKVLENLRPPFFDEQYNLIIKDSFSKSGFLRTFKMKIRKFVREIFGIRQKDIDNINENTDSMVFIISKN